MMHTHGRITKLIHNHCDTISMSFSQYPTDMGIRAEGRVGYSKWQHSLEQSRLPGAQKPTYYGKRNPMCCRGMFDQRTWM
jgi:hypothetical protein